MPEPLGPRKVGQFCAWAAAAKQRVSQCKEDESRMFIMTRYIVAIGRAASPDLGPGRPMIPDSAGHRPSSTQFESASSAWAFLYLNVL